MQKMGKKRFNQAPALQAGVSLLEVLVGLVLIAIAGIGATYSMITSLRVEKATQVHMAANSLASAKVEELTAVDTLDLDSTFNESDVVLTLPELQVEFSRSTTITVNSDQSRTIDVTVRSLSERLPTEANFTTRFALWE